MVSNGAFDSFVLSIDAGHPARAWLALNEGGLVGGCPELAVHSIRAAGLEVRTIRVEDPDRPTEDRRNRVTLIIGTKGTVEAATAL